MLIKEKERIDNYIIDAIEKIKTVPIEVSSTINQSSTRDAAYLTLSDMTLLAKIAEDLATDMGIDIVFSLVDCYGLQRFYFSMPNALLVSHKLAVKKAYSAVAMKMPTHQLMPLLKENASLYGLDNDSKISGISGGFPCWNEGRLIVGIGISGGTVEQDIAIALGVMEKFSQLRFSLYSK